MGKRDPRVDDYIERSADFAKPILRSLRATVHAACPDVEEAMKWSFPHFLYKGMLCSMASFKQHCAFGFWKGSLVLGASGSPEAMGQFGRITGVAALPPRKQMATLIRKAMALNDEGVKVERPRRSGARAPVKIPAELAAALRQNKKAHAVFTGFPPSHRREYADWIAEAKGEETRNRRLKTAIQWIAAGKRRNWKYMRA
jgi:uncharacterized protein YdeI (YjbR/CyaY-like superfamily)